MDQPEPLRCLNFNDLNGVMNVQPAGVVAEHGTSGQPGADALCVFAIDCYLDTLVRQVTAAVNLVLFTQRLSYRSKLLLPSVCLSIHVAACLALYYL